MAAVYQAIGSGGGNTGDVTVGWPAAHAANDIGILVCCTANQAPATPSGWTPLNGAGMGTGTPGAAGAIRLTAFWKRAASSSEASVVVADPGDHCYGRITTMRGCKTSGSPIDAYANSVKDTASIYSLPPGVTASEGGNDILYFCARDYDSPAAQAFGEINTNLTGLFERGDAGTGLGTGSGLAVYSGTLAAPGDSGVLAASLLNSTVEEYLCVAFLAAGAATRAAAAVYYQHGFGNG